MARPILLDPAGGPVRVLGEILEPGPAALKIDVWRHVRHPPPDLIHAYAVKTALDEALGYYLAGPPAALIGKVLSWIWSFEHVFAPRCRWRVRVDVQQDGVSVPGYPSTYQGVLPEGHPLGQLKVTEVIDRRERARFEAGSL